MKQRLKRQKRSMKLKAGSINRLIKRPNYYLDSPRKKEAMRKIAQCAKEYDVVLEINLKGTKYGKKMYSFGESYMYPNTETFRIIGEVGAKVCFGYDAHHPNNLKNRRKIEYEIKEQFKDFLNDDILIIYYK